MKRRWIALLLLLLLVSALCGCAGEEEAPQVMAEPAETLTPPPAETEAPGTAVPETAAPAAAETPRHAAAETPAPTQAPPSQTPTPTLAPAPPAETEEEEIVLTEDWQLAYLELLQDPALLDAVIGENGDYRKGYFGGWDNPDYQLPFSSYATADLDADGTPELLLDSEEMLLTDLIGWNGDYVYIDYDDYLGLLPELGASLVHGHWHGTGGSYQYEYSVFGLPGHKLLAYFDHSEPGYGAVTWSFMEEDGSWYSGAEDGDSRRYEAMVAQYVNPALRLEDLDYYPLDSRKGLARPQELADLPTLEEVAARFPGTCRRFLKEKGWQSLGLNLAEEGLEGALWDLDRDGVQELLLRDRERCVLFRYDGGEDRMLYLGQVRGDIVGVLGHELAARVDDGWMVYNKRHGDLKEEFFTQFSEEYASLIGWLSVEELSSDLF